LYEGGEKEDDDENEDEAAATSDKPDSDKFIFKPFQIDKKFRDNLPYLGIVEFDYVSTRRPLQGADKEAAKSSGSSSQVVPAEGAAQLFEDADEGDWLVEGSDGQGTLENSGDSRSVSSANYFKERWKKVLRVCGEQ